MVSISRTTAALVLAMSLPPAVADTSEHVLGDRRYVLVSPETVTGPAPMILALHGGFGNADYFARAVPLDVQAEAMGFRIAYLEGVGQGHGERASLSWNAGDCCGTAFYRDVDDMAYIDAVIEDLAAADLVTSLAMFGHGNGGMMTYRYLCEGRYPVTAAVILAAARMVDHCALKTPTRVLVLHGQFDRDIPLVGGTGDGVTRVHYTSMTQSVDGLAQAGAMVEARVLPFTGHSIREINSTLISENRVSLSATLAQVLTQSTGD